MSQRQPPHPDDSFVTTSMSGGGLTARQWRILTLLGILLVATVGGAYWLVRGPADDAGTALKRGSPVSIPKTPTATPIPLVSFAPSGSPTAEAIAFSPGQVVQCGVAANGTVVLTRQRGEGQQWTTQATGIAAGGCPQIAINLANAQQMELSAFQCGANCTEPSREYSIIYRSDDDGAHWRALPLPDGTATAQLGYGWAPNGALWVACQGRHLLAMSVAGQPLRWANAISTPQQVPLVNRIDYAAHAVFVTLNAQGNLTFRSTDQGQTWQQVTPTVDGAPITIGGATPDGSRLLATTQVGQPILSLDDGITWQHFPTVSGTVANLFATQDGTVVAVSYLKGTAQILILASDVNKWQSFGYFDASPYRVVGVEEDAQGRFAAVWAAPTGTGELLGFAVLPAAA